MSWRKNTSSPVTSPPREDVVEEVEAPLEGLAEPFLLAADGAADDLVPGAISGYASPIAAMAASTRGGVTMPAAPSRNAWRTARRMMRRST